MNHQRSSAGREAERRCGVQSLSPAAEVKLLARQLGVDPHALQRSKEGVYKTMELSTSSSLDEIARAIEHEPILMERPIVVVGDRAALGRPPENVLALL